MIDVAVEMWLKDAREVINAMYAMEPRGKQTDTISNPAEIAMEDIPVSFCWEMWRWGR